MKFGRHLFAATVAALALTAGSTTPASAQTVVTEVVITHQPPMRLIEIQPAPPGPEYVWHRGDWVFSAERQGFVWHPGHFVPRPDRSHTIWFPGEWVNFQGAWHYVPGHWRTASEGPPPPYETLINVVREPPPPRVEVIPVGAPGYDWDPGHWAWDGADFRWVRGHHIPIPREFHGWVGGHWYRSGSNWFFRNGYWH